MKRIVLTILASLSVIWADEEKSSYLPPYEPHSFVSPKVQEFLESAGNADLEQNWMTGNFDVLGRKLKQNYQLNYRPLILDHAGV